MRWKIGAALLVAGMMFTSCTDSNESVQDELQLLSINPYQAKAGDTITLTGANFGQGMQICFGSGTSMCSPIVITSSSTGYAVVPAGTGSNLEIRLVLPNGQSVSQSGVVFSYSDGSNVNGGGNGNGNGGNVNGGGNGNGNGGNVNGGGNGNGNGGNENEHIIGGDAPRIEKMTPTGGVAGTSVTISGANLGGTYQVCFASTCVNVTANAEGNKIIVTAPEGTGNVQVRVDGKVNDKDWSLKAGSFSYIDGGNTDPQVPVVEWCRLNSVQPTLEIGKIATSYAEVFKEGCTPDAASKCSNMVGQIGYIDANSPNVLDPLQWNWLDAHPNPMFSHENGNQNDEYMGELQTMEEGNYLVAFRFSMDNVHWTYCDYSSSSDGFSIDQAGTMTVAAQKPMTIDWCRIVNGNTYITSNVSELSEGVYAQFYVSDDCTKDMARCSSLKAQLGYGKPRFSTPEELNENYVWMDATFNDQYDGSGGTDHNEYMGFLMSSEADTYSVLFRGSVDGGQTWTYCDTSDNNSFSAGDAMTWEVRSGGEVKEKAIEWCVVQFPESAELRLGNSFNVFGRVYVSGCTDGGVECKGVMGEAGYGIDDNAENFMWYPASYNPSPTVDVGNNNEFVASLTPATEGSFRYGYRFSLDGENWVYCDTAGGEQYQQEKLGTVNVKEDKDTIGWCRLQHPGELNGYVDTQTEAVYGQVLVENCTGRDNKCASVKAQVGYGMGYDLSSFTYVDATYNTAIGNNDEYMATLNVDTAGQYRLVYRFSVDNGSTWEYCDYDDTAGFNINNAGTMNIAEKSVSQYQVGWCRLQYPVTITAKPFTTTKPIYGQVFVENCTGKGSACPAVKAQVGYGTSDDPSSYTYSDATYNAASGDTGNNDEFMGTMLASNVGNYRYAYRFSVDNGATWKYCDSYGNDVNVGFNATFAGDMTVDEAYTGINWCRVQDPGQVTVEQNTDVTFYGQVYSEDGCTGTPNQQCTSTVKAQVGYGTGDNPASFTYTNAVYNKYEGNNDEYMASLNISEAGNYKVVYRFSIDGGITWEYCDYDEANGFNINNAATLTVTASQTSIIDVCQATYRGPDTHSTFDMYGHPNKPTLPIYGQVHVQGCTGTNGSPCPNVQAQICYNDATKIPSQIFNPSICKPAEYYGNAGDNDEYVSTLTIPETGSYRVWYKFSADNGTTWTIAADCNELRLYIFDKGYIQGIDFECGIIESSSDVTLHVGNDASGEDVTLYAQIYMPGCTENQKCDKIQDVTMYYGYAEEDGEASLPWPREAWYNDQQSGDFNNDEYMTTLHFYFTNIGEIVRFVFKFTLKDGDVETTADCYANWSLEPVDGKITIVE